MAIVEKEGLLCYLKGYSVSIKKEGKLMLASKMLEKLTYECARGNVDKDITALVYDSRKIEKGCMFVCIAGANFDGHSCVGEAAEKGAAVLITQSDVTVPEDSDVTVVRVDDTRYALAFLAAAWFGNPAERMRVIGITGTKGKTTTTYLVKSILEHAGRKVGLIGTIEAVIGEKHIPANNTTPESYVIQDYFRQMADAGCDTVVMEVSSQGLMMHRTQGFVFDIGIFTNIEPDHIGPNEHNDFEEYMACKGLLFKQCRIGIVNGDDPHYQTVTAGHTCELETYGFSDGVDLQAYDMQLVTKPGSLGVDFRVRGLMNMDVETNTPGKFSVYNALTAMAICRHFDVSE